MHRTPRYAQEMSYSCRIERHTLQLPELYNYVRVARLTRINELQRAPANLVEQRKALTQYRKQITVSIAEQPPNSTQTFTP